MNSRPRSRPTTPLRHRSESILSENNLNTPLEGLRHAFTDLADGLGTLNENMSDLNAMNDSLATFSESFASFLYGLNINAFCVDYPEAPCAESFKRAAHAQTVLNNAQLESQDPGASFSNQFSNDVPESKGERTASQSGHSQTRMRESVGIGKRDEEHIPTTARNASSIRRGSRGPTKPLNSSKARIVR